MSDQLLLHLDQLDQVTVRSQLKQIRHGIEKESLRVAENGHIAQSVHPEGLGSALTHPYITTDFSEALLEFITPVFTEAENSLAFLAELHRFVYQEIPSEEFLWTSSMPCILDEEDKIPLAQYGSSNIGKLKTLYRKGLSNRYGSSMQTIAGIHYNFSLSEDFWRYFHEQDRSGLSLQDFKTVRYFALIRNFRRYSWLLLYLFGASPAVCKTFVKAPNHGLESFDQYSYFLPYGTSLRMGDLGYTSAAQSGLYISYNDLSSYASGLNQAISTPYTPYEKFKPENGRYKQVNSAILQIENEFYSTIRPKRPVPSGRKPIDILLEQGVEYVEVRCLDLNPFLPVGLDDTQIHFLNSFLLYCLLQESPASNPEEHREIDDNLKQVVKRGRDPQLLLHKQGRETPLPDWGAAILEDVQTVAALVDDCKGDGARHVKATQAQLAKLENSELTPSAQVLERMSSPLTPFAKFAMDQSLACSDYFRSQALPAQKLAELETLSKQSLADQRAIEAADKLDFDSFLTLINQR